MNRISILDCTLRDGGYVNDFNFGKNVISEIIAKLSKASIDIIECGFLRSNEHDEDSTLFGSVEEIRNIIHEKNRNLMYVGMIQYGAISADEISPCDHSSIDGIRVTFHEHEIENAFVLGRELMKKGYIVFMQPVGTTTYTDEHLLDLIKRVNELHPYAFYMVDTLGKMYKNDLLRMFYLVDHNLDKGIVIGFHSHNNLQMSFANAQEIIQINSPRRIIIDSSIYGMGRGAGNLNTELITQHINSTFGMTYENAEILEIIDEYIKPLTLEYKWGYDSAYFIAAAVDCHPNYASFLLNKQTLRVRDIYSILKKMSDEKRALFDSEYIAKEYVEYLSHHVEDDAVATYINSQIAGRKVMILAPGKSLSKKAKEINYLIESENYYVVSVNFVPEDIPVNLAFVSNIKRFKNVADLKRRLRKTADIVVTSNIMTEEKDGVRVIDFRSYNNENRYIVDNAGLMCINFLNKVGVKDITLAGFDGFANRQESNFYDKSLIINVDEDRLQEINKATSQRLKQLQTQMNISFAYETKYK